MITNLMISKISTAAVKCQGGMHVEPVQPDGSNEWMVFGPGSISLDLMRLMDSRLSRHEPSPEVKGKGNWTIPGIDG